MKRCTTHLLAKATVPPTCAVAMLSTTMWSSMPVQDDTAMSYFASMLPRSPDAPNFQSG